MGQLRFAQIVLLLGLAIGPGCSDGGGGESSGNFEEHLAALKSGTISDSSRWASAAKATYEKQVASGKVDDQAALRELEPESIALKNAICGRIEKDKKLSNPGNDGSSEDVRTAVQNSVSDVFIQATASDPKLLVAFGMTSWNKWPPFWLKDPRPPGDGAVDPNAAALGMYIKPELLDGQGGLKIPALGTPGFAEFSDWYYFDRSRTNALLNQALTTGQPIHDGVQACLHGS